MDESILTRLKNETADLHRATEERMPLLRDDLTLDGYRRLLAGFHAFYAAFERDLAAALARRPLGFDYEPRRKTPLLAADLAYFGAPAEAIFARPEGAATPALAELEDVFGALYVVEGSTLGGQLIARHLAARFDLDAARGAAFFSGYGGETGARWNEFRAALERFAAGPSDAGRIVAAARATFAAIGETVIKSYG